MVETDNNDQAKDIPPWLQPVPEAEGEGGMLASGKMKMVVAGIAVVVVIVFVAAVVFFYQDAPKEGPRHIAADAEPIRERPAEAGGMQVDHQDKGVLEIGDGAPATARVQIGGQPEQPVTEIPDLPADTADEVAETPDAIGDLAEAALEQDTQPVAPAAEAPVQEQAAPAVTTEQHTSVGAGGQYMVQLGAYGTEQSAATAWRTIRGTFSGELGELSPSYVPVQSGDRTLYRLRVGMLETRAAADAVCISLRAQQQACFVINP